MLFNSPVFLFLFLPFTLLFYYLLPKKFRNGFLFLVSLLFYTWGEKELVVLIISSTLIDFFSGLIINSGRRKIGLLISIVFNLSILFYFKYSNFIFTNFIDFLHLFDVSIDSATKFANITLPLGISFYTFQTMSYTIDVYRGKVKATKNFINFATYVTLFPQLIAGPIILYKDIEKELIERKTSIYLFSEGVERFIIGLAKKMIIANNCAYLADGIFSLPHDEMSALTAWLGVIAYSFQIYFDFSGYSDMAIGLGKMFGFNFLENFNYPYISKSIQEFWKRWHISLTNWFREYLYFSLGGNRKGGIKTYFNLFVVFLITGLWHGASWTFVCWGLWHGVFIVIERIGFNKVLKKLPDFITRFYLLIIVGFSWVIFRSNTILDAFNYIKAMFNFSTVTNQDFLNFYLTKEVLSVLIIAIIFSTPIYKNINSFIFSLDANSFKYKQFASIKIICLLLLFMICFVYIATDSYNPFIYFRF